jgi:hypothetical protein
VGGSFGVLDGSGGLTVSKTEQRTLGLSWRPLFCLRLKPVYKPASGGYYTTMNARQTVTEAADVTRWYAYVLWFFALRLWHDLPGPTPVKIALIAVCFAIPGPLDEIALIALPAAARKIRKRTGR